MIRSTRLCLLALGVWAASAASARATAAAAGDGPYDVLISGATIYDGSGSEPFAGEVAIAGDRIAYVGRKAPGSARERLDAHGKAVAPGFINMLAHPEESLLADGRALSDLRQGVTLEVLGEDSMGPLSARMKELALQREGDIRYPIDWTTLGEYLAKLERRGIAPNVASFVGAGTVRTYVLGERDVQPSAQQLQQMRTLVRQAMEEGALGVTTALIYSPNDYAHTPELMALASESARCGGIYSVHMRSEGDRLLEGVQETIDIARASGAPGRDLSPQGGRRAQLEQARCADRHGRGSPQVGRAHHRGHVRVHRRCDRARRGHAAVGAGRRARGVDRAPQAARRTPARAGGYARPGAAVGKSLRRRRRCRHAAAGLQESRAQAADRQDARRRWRACAGCRPRMRRSTW